MGLSERLRYGPRRAQVVEALVPDGPGPHPVAVLLHGGFWRASYTRSLMRPLARDLVARGWAAWNLEFRRVGPLSGGGVPATLDDVAAGIDLLAEHAERLGLDLTRVVAVGHSAGGQLALWAAGRGTAARVALTGVVSQGGVCDLAEAARRGLGGGAVRAFTGGDPEALALADPMRRLPTGVPALLVHGGADDRVPAALSERYACAARAAGDDVELDLRPGEGHFEHLDAGSGAWRRAVDWLEARARR